MRWVARLLWMTSCRPWSAWLLQSQTSADLEADLCAGEALKGDVQETNSSRVGKDSRCDPYGRGRNVG